MSVSTKSSEVEIYLQEKNSKWNLSPATEDMDNIYTMTLYRTDMFVFDPMYDACPLDISVKFVYSQTLSGIGDEVVFLSTDNATEITEGFITTRSTPNSNLTSITYTLNNCRDYYFQTFKRQSDYKSLTPFVPGIPQPHFGYYVESIESVTQYNVVYATTDPATGQVVKSSRTFKTMCTYCQSFIAQTPSVLPDKAGKNITYKMQTGDETIVLDPQEYFFFDMIESSECELQTSLAT